MKKTVLMLLIASSLVGCASADKVAMPHGKWQTINQAGFVPASTKRYIEGVDIIINNEVEPNNEAGEESEAEASDNLLI